MPINPQKIKQLRAAKQWSQDQLSQACGVNIRTIQRLERTGKASLETVRALAAVFEVEVASLQADKEEKNQQSPTAVDAVISGLRQYAVFEGRASRAEYGWFFLFVGLVAGAAMVIHPQAYLLVGILLIVPLIAVGQRRLHATGHSGWWQLMWLVPFGQVVVLIMLFMPADCDALKLAQHEQGMS